LDIEFLFYFCQWVSVECVGMSALPESKGIEPPFVDSVVARLDQVLTELAPWWRIARR
jgi:hypothetical protein